MTEYTAESQIAAGTVALLFTAPWCGACKMIHPAMEKKASDYKDSVQFVEVNADKHPELVETHNIKALPTLLVLKDGEPVTRIIGTAASGFKPEDLS